MDRYEITKTCSEMLDPWVVHGYKSLSCNNFLNPSQFYQQGALYLCFKKMISTGLKILSAYKRDQFTDKNDDVGVKEDYDKDVEARQPS